MEELITDYVSGALHAAEVKLALTEALSKILKVIFFLLYPSTDFPQGSTGPILLVEITQQKM
jgi:hypothetical protein